jgi:hypothetical protein
VVVAELRHGCGRRAAGGVGRLSAGSGAVWSWPENDGQVHPRGRRLSWSLGEAFRARWYIGLRAGLSVGVPLLVGVAVGRPSWGALASIGGFAGFYGPDTPYRHQSGWWGVGAALAVVVPVGSVCAPQAWLSVVFAGMVAAVSRFVCLALRVPPPREYLIILAALAIHGPRQRQSCSHLPSADAAVQELWVRPRGISSADPVSPQASSQRMLRIENLCAGPARLPIPKGGLSQESRASRKPSASDGRPGSVSSANGSKQSVS